MRERHVSRVHIPTLIVADALARTSMKSAARCDMSGDTHCFASHQPSNVPQGPALPSAQCPCPSSWGLRSFPSRARCSLHRPSSSTRTWAHGDYPPNLSISVSGGEEINGDSPSSGERTGRSPPRILRRCGGASMPERREAEASSETATREGESPVPPSARGTASAAE